jgi:uncharacterized membrane protein (DUF485 family)
MDWKIVSYSLAFLLIASFTALIALGIYVYQANRAYDKLETERKMENLFAQKNLKNNLIALYE